MRGALLWYDQVLKARPLLTKSVTAGIVVSSSDIAIQSFGEEKEGGKTKTKRLNWERTALIGIGYGSLCFSPVLHFVTTRWEIFLPSRSLVALVFKTTTDMLTSLPFNLSVSLFLQSVARREDGKTMRDSLLTSTEHHVENVKTNIWPAVLGAWKFWPMVTMTNYMLVPLHYRVLFLNAGSFGFNAWMISRFTKNESRSSVD